jgi:E3 ubiquitin-protein ligase NEDD4
VKRVEEQFKAFETGFYELIPYELISVFDERELEVCFGHGLPVNYCRSQLVT